MRKRRRRRRSLRSLLGKYLGFLGVSWECPGELPGSFLGVSWRSFQEPSGSFPVACQEFPRGLGRDSPGGSQASRASAIAYVMRSFSVANPGRGPTG